MKLVEQLDYTNIKNSMNGHDSTYTKYLEWSNPQRQEVEWWLPGPGRREELLFNGYRVSIWEDEKLLEMDGGDGCKAL